MSSNFEFNLSNLWALSRYKSYCSGKVVLGFDAYASLDSELFWVVTSLIHARAAGGVLCTNAGDLGSKHRKLPLNDLIIIATRDCPDTTHESRRYMQQQQDTNS